MMFEGSYGNKGLIPVSTGSYEIYLKTGDDTKSVKEEETTVGSRIIVSATAKQQREKKLQGYFKTVNGQDATTITKLHTAALTLSSRPNPCINNIFLPSMILEVTSFSMTSVFPEFAVGTKWMVQNYTIERTPDKGFNAYSLSLTLYQYFGNLEA